MDSTFNVLAAALRRIKREAIAAAPTAAADDVIADAPLLQQWVPGKHSNLYPATLWRGRTFSCYVATMHS